MKKYGKHLILLTLTTLLLLSASLTVFAASAKKIAIKGSLTSMTVGQEKDLEVRITPSNARVRDRNIVWTSSNPKVIKVTENYDDDIEIRALKAGTATITVKIKGTSLKATRKITVKKADTTSISSYTKKISSYKSDLKDIYSEMKKATVKKSYVSRRTQAAKYERMIEKIEDKLDALEDKIELRYDLGKITAKQYRTLEYKLESVEDYIDTLEDYLEYKFGDFD